jgi:hypothetical protein
MRDRSYLLLIPVAALLAVLPLVARGCSCGHDFEFHLLNWLEVGSQWKQGIPLPHWEFTAAWNSGEPRFVFYPPLSWIIGALLGLVLPWAAVPATFIWLALALCGFTMHRLAREWTRDGNACFAACFYIVNPYMLFTSFERSALGELLAAAWIPLLLLAILRPRITIPGIALPVTLLWLTNDPAAVIGCYTLALLAAFRVIRTSRVSPSTRAPLREAARIAAGLGAGLALAGFYLLPAIAEQRWVRIGMTAVKGTRVQDNFLFGRFGGPSHQAILRTASLCSIALLLLIAILAAASYRGAWRPGESESDYRRFAILSLSLLSAAGAFVLTAPSAFLWRHLPELKYLQFPWRFNLILGAAAAALLALALSRIRLKPPSVLILSLALPLVLGLSGDLLFRQLCNRGNDVKTLVAGFYSGNNIGPRDDYPPAGSDSQSTGHSNPAAWIAAAPVAPAPPGIPRSYSVVLADRLHFDVASPVPAFLVINLRDYPAWRIAINGILAPGHPHRPDGLIALPIPAGRSKIDIVYALTSDRIIGWLLTAFAAAVLLVVWRKDRLPLAQASWK